MDTDILVGKTLECLALILLNPSTGRNPARIKWDENVALHVHEVRVGALTHF